MPEETGFPPKSAAAAVRKSIYDHLRHRKIERMKSMKGKLRLDKMAEEIGQEVHK